MGPDSSKELFHAFVEPSISHITWGVEATRRADDTLQGLAEALNGHPVKCPVVEPVLPLKLLALSQISYEEMGVPGFNPGELVTEGAVTALASPRFDEYTTGEGAYSVSTRALLFLPSESFDSNDGEIEIFGLNISAESTKTPETTIATSSEEVAEKPASFVLLPSTAAILKPVGDPVHGRTNIFAVRNKRLHSIQIYGVTIHSKADAGLPQFGSNTQRENNGSSITLDMPFNQNATIIQLRGEQFDQAVKEFQKAIDSINFSKEFAGEEAQYSEAERAALRDLQISAARSPY